jgi:hypothetical protein
MPTTWEYRTEILTSLVGRDKLRIEDLHATLKTHGADGWELVNCDIDADLKGVRDGHLLIFKRPVEAA